MDFSEEFKSQEAAREQLDLWKRYQAEGHTNPNTISDDVADESQLAFHEFVWGAENWPTKQELGISRQAWKCAIAVAIDKMNERS